MDAWVLARICRVLEKEWGGSRIQGAWTDKADRVVLRLRKAGRSGFLVLSPLGSAPGLAVAGRRRAAPPRPPAIAAYLRAHAEGRRLVAVRPRPFERVVTLDVGRGGRIVLDLAARPGVVGALDSEGRIRAVHRPGGKHPDPRWRPGGVLEFLPPPEERAQPREVPAATVAAWANDGEPLHRRILGLGPHLAREVAHRIRCGGDPGRIWGELLAAYGTDGPLWAYEDVLSVWELTHRPFSGRCVADPLEAAAAWMEARLDAEQRARAERSQAAARTAFRRRLERRIARIRADLDSLPDPEALRACADALACALDRVRPGASEARVPDPRNPGSEVRVALDPSLSPARNLERLYREARRAERARRIAGERLEAALREMDAGPPAEGAEHRAPAAPGGQGPFRRYVSSDGWPIWVGRNSRENDRLLREARPWDLWLHARDAPGAHVLVRRPGREARCPERTLLEAAGLAAAHSRRSADGAVEVMVAEAGRVRRPKGAGPGQVVVSGDRTVRVRPGWGSPKPVEGRG